MKNFIILTTSVLILPVLFFACGKEKNTEDYVVSENFIIYTDISYPETPMDNVDSLTKTAPTPKFTYALNGASVELFIDNIKVKAIDCQYIPPSEYISVADFNFDGYDDIFIPFEDPTNYGTYWCYQPAKNDFVTNDELNSIGRIMTISENNTLIQNTSDDLTDRTVEYQWNGNQLKAICKTEKYLSTEDNKIHTNVYNYDSSGTEYLADIIIEGE